MLTILHYDHSSNAKCRKLFLYICFFFFFFFFFLHFANATCRNAFYFYKFLHLALCHILLWKKQHHFRQHLIWNFHENRIPFYTFLPIQIYVLSDLSNSIRSENNTLLLSFPDAHANPRNIWVGPPGGYRETLWNALLLCRQFQQSKVHLVHQVQMDFRWPVAVFTFFSP